MSVLGAALVFVSPLAVMAAGPPDNGWRPLGALPESLDAPVSALAVSPTDGQLVLAGTQSGSIYRSADGGSTWALVRQGLGRGVVTVGFNPYKPGAVMAGVRGAGAFRSTDGGQTWAAAAGLGSATPRSFSFTKVLQMAGTNRGVFSSRDGVGWAPSGLTQLSVSALAMATSAEPAKVVAGADATQGSEGLPVFASPDGGSTWTPLAGPATASNMVAAIAVAPLADKAGVRPLLMGTNNGLFTSPDNGATWVQVTGGGILPGTDFSSLAFAARSERYYAASDGGGSELAGGLWGTSDAGQHFTSLKPPVGSITALAVSNDDQPIVYAAAFRPADHSVSLWAYRDAGGAPVAAAGIPAASKAAPVAAAEPAPLPAHRGWSQWLGLLATGPEGPYLAVGLGAILVLMLSLVAYARRSRI